MFIGGVNVDDKRLQEIGGKLDVTPEDISGMKRFGLKNRLIYWIITAAITILSFILGFFLGKGSCPPAGGGYPFSMALTPVVFPGKNRSKAVVLLVSAVAFLVALNAVPVFGQAVLYDVFSRKIT